MIRSKSDERLAPDAAVPARSDTRSPASSEGSAADDDDDDAPRVPEVPSPTLPKGGGAVRGLGESFVVNPANGTLSVTVPVATSKARGLEPALALRYDSGAGNGPYGEGWDLKLASVARKTDKLLPRYGEDDAFLVDGEELVLSHEPDSGAWTQGARDAGAHRVRCFRPRIEAAYDRIERWTRKTDGDVHWRVRDKDGRTNVFGESAAARIADPADARRIFRWLVERTYDDRGNLIVYRYRAEDRTGVAATLWEENRAPANTLIDRIQYGARAPYDPSVPAPHDPTAYLFEVVFDYGERDGVHDQTPPPYAPPSTWTARSDAFSTYKPGFELRCYRLCKRILTFHRFEALGPAPVLVRETRLRYDDDPCLTKLVGVTGLGWRDGASVAYPEVQLSYTRAQLDPSVRSLDIASLENLPPPIDGKRARWIDLDGEGLPGVLIEDRPAWLYKRNVGGGALAPVERLPTRPSLDLSEGGQLLDVGGDGTKSLVHFGGPAPGHFARSADFDWTPFEAFRKMPNVRFDDPNLRFVDLDGDGRSDLLVTEDAVLRWYPSLGTKGFGDAEFAQKARDEEKGPTLVFADAEQAIYLADMTGDGLTDLVRIRNGQVCYWPNLGYGRFGARVTMGNAPRFGATYEFQQSRVRLADIDGSGTADILYCEGDRVRYWLNLAGNRFSDESSIAGLPFDSAARVEAIDLLGNGTSCLVWTSSLASQARQPLRYVELTGGVKPHLLQEIDNNLGKAISVDFVASTKFYVDDRAAGRAWVTRAPFPIQVVARTTTVDRVGGNQLVAEYSYHHGFYDGFEREFRGFGMVEQRDTQTLAALKSKGTFPLNAAYVPPVRTRTWFHTGAFLEGDALRDRFRREWFAQDGDQAHLDDGVMPGGLDPTEWREALRALRGKPLRVETYADDEPPSPETPIPYVTVEHNYRVRAVQRRGVAAHGVFACDSLETLTYSYERNASDPRVEHEYVLRVGPFGAVEQRARVGYPRRATSAGTLIAYFEDDVLARADEAALYRVNVVAETRLYEVTGLVPPTASPFVLARAQLDTIAALAGTAGDLPFDRAAPSLGLARRGVRRTQIRYYADDATTPLPLGAFGARALVYQSSRAAMPTTMLAVVLPAGVDAAAMLAAGYVQRDGYWWAPSATIEYSEASFFQPARFVDPFTNETIVTYDSYQLLPTKVTNALKQSLLVEYDYRAQATSKLTDVNGNATLATYDALGLLRDVAKTGKNGEGDTLAAPTTHYEYVLSDWRDLGAPNHTYARQRLVHGTDGFQETLVYSDGFGRELMTKVKANPGNALAVQNGTLVTVDTTDRWLASGRTVYDNKGNGVRKYEPFFAVGSAYEGDSILACLGVSSVLHYDPVGRVVRTDNPDGSFATTAIGAWELRESDGNDNVNEEGQLWANRPGQTAAEQRATAATRLHRRTPTRHIGDAFGRRISTFRDNTIQAPLVDTPEANHLLYETRRVLDTEGRPLSIFDDRGLKAPTPYATLQQTFDMLGQRVRAIGADTGTSYLLRDCQAKPFFSRDARGAELRWGYDALRRPTTLEATDTATSGAPFVMEKTVYGDDPSLGAIDPAANLLGRVYQRFDEAGIATSTRYDFKSNVLEQQRQLIVSYSGAPDWTKPYLAPFVTAITYDALDRVLQTLLPRRNGSAGGNNLMARAYLVHGPLSRITVTAQYGSAPVDVLAAIEYDAKGRRTSETHGNEVVRTYDYDALTFRLAAVSVTRNGGSETLQDLAYTYDAVGNVTEISDAAQPTVFAHNQQLDARMTYAYDAIYQLIDASGRELHDPMQPTDVDAPFGSWPPDANDLVNYREHYDYDSAGNITRLKHVANNNTQSWTRGYGYDPQSNRLTGTSVPGAPIPTVFGATYDYDLAGNIVSMPHLRSIGWDLRGRLVSADRMGGGVVYHAYEESGVRVRKVQTRRVGASEVVSYERIYIGAYELYRELASDGTSTKEIESLSALDGSRRAALVETEISGTTISAVLRYFLDNHLGSAVLELDGLAALLSYEEYHPFGTSAFRARKTIAEVSLKRYRFLARERDDETGFYYCEARHYCAWLGRWINPDPKGIDGGPNQYAYANNSPVVASDPGGRDPDDEAKGPQPPAYNPGPTQTAGVPKDVPVGKLNTEINAFTLFQSPSDPDVGWTNQTYGQLHVRGRTGQNTEQGFMLSLGGAGPLSSAAAGSHPDSSYFVGSALYTLHTGGEADSDSKDFQVTQGNWFNAGFVFGNPGAGNNWNPALTYIRALSLSGGGLGLDLNLGASAQLAGSVNNRTVSAYVNPYIGANFSFPLGKSAQGNVEGTVGANTGLAGAKDATAADPSVPASLQIKSGLGVQWSAGAKNDYTIGVEALFNIEPKSNIAGPTGLALPPLSFGLVGTVSAF